ncbi:CDP-glycerol:glycerophosphate glycerophosphotransferase [Pseudoalteromonas sp. SCSIO_11900]|uniref:CDP-glycerol--glycerophosphate glycerophosphotransferase n=1 Tax=Pseudoalteromonas sp. SCSIO_11900 TaxID=1461766 RepID=UPI0004459C97|nr:CDP-glycerol--glycerophosphate glycerophosphotransferase [Pseudoalteromonas sp. SCSIO_11900]EWS98488.1 CDP-glycerol:glycerophosphate glycerophosphotransferase [Pseudoalteromonas sp. SCSIO_11900]
MPKHYLFYVEQPYSFAILRPLQEVIRARGDIVYWYIRQEDIAKQNLLKDELQLLSVEEVKAFNPRAVFVPGNIVPDFFPGIKVQVFHGLEYKKKGHFSIRGFFDLYCTHGPLTTIPFNKLAKQHKHFKVVETGWPKLDPYFNYQQPQNKTPVILYAPTFSPKLTSLHALYSQIKALIESNKYIIKLKFHPKTDKVLQQMYQQLTKYENFEIANKDNLIPLIQEADIVISDTSSAVDESLILGKTVITYNNQQPQAALLNITAPELLSETLEKALYKNPNHQQKIKDYIEQVHPFKDGNSSLRILSATEDVIKEGVKTKPLNLLRKYKIRKSLNYMKFK